ncbi:unnamed protein product [Rhodiola kirilowii]
MQQGDFTSSSPFYNNYPPPHHHQQPPPPSQFPNPTTYSPDPNSLPASYASAPPFAQSDYPNYPPPQTYHQPYQPIPDPVITPPVAQQAPPNHSYNPPPPSNPNLQGFNSVTAPVQQPTAFPSFESHAPPQQPQYYSSFEQHQGGVNYGQPPLKSSSFPDPNAPIPNPAAAIAPYSGSYNLAGYDNLYDNNHVKFDHGTAAAIGGGGGYFDDKSSRYGGYNNSRPEMGSDYYGKRPDSGGYSGQNDDLYGDGVYAYQAKSKVEPYGARGTGPKSSTWTGAFDDYGRAISFPVPGEKSSSTSSPKIVKAVPKVETQQDVHSGVQKFRVKLLAESSGQSTMDVLCQIGLDGVRMLDPSTNRTLRIYPLETITRCDVTDSSIFTFWSKSSVDIEPRRIRLQSNRYTTNTILDIVTAATVQIKEMGGTSRPSDYTKTAEQQLEKKKGITDWMNIIKPANEEKDHWVPDEAVMKCTACGTDFGAFVRRHHCRNCGDIYCDKCTHGRIALTAEENAQPVRVCDRCLAEVTQRLSNAKELASKKTAGLQSHQDLAKKLQEEMERNRKAASGSKSEVSGKRMKEVACPTCTVHLQVQVPSSGSETIECGVCQHPFLVSAH